MHQREFQTSRDLLRNFQSSVVDIRAIGHCDRYNSKCSPFHRADSMVIDLRKKGINSLGKQTHALNVTSGGKND